MISKMKPSQDGGSHIGIVFNGSPLFTGQAGNGESNIRQWIIENDWLEAIIALPDQLFYNTGISTYIWILNNHKSEQRKGKIQLINATGAKDDELIKAGADNISRIKGIGRKTARAITASDAGQFLKQEFACASAESISIVTVDDDEYPETLRKP